MSVPRIITSNGEMSEYSEGRMKSISPAINLQLQLSCKDSSAADNQQIPVAFRPRPKISRTPPNSNDADATNIHITIDSIMDDDNTEEIKSDYVYNDNTYQSSKMNSPSLSIEYPPGSSIPMIKKRKKFQFKKSHYQKFIGTSSAKKTKEIRKTMMRDRSRSNSLISYQSSNANSFQHDMMTQKQQQRHHDKSKTPQQSIPPSPPSDDIISTLSQMMNKTPNKLPHHIATNSGNIILPKTNHSNNESSDEFTVSSSPSLIQESNTTTQQSHTMTANTTRTKYYEYPYETKQQWTTFVGKKQETISMETKTKLASTRSNYRPKKPQHHSFGSGAIKTEKSFDPDRIRMALSEYEQQKGQNLEEIFRPKKSCCYCTIL